VNGALIGAGAALLGASSSNVAAASGTAWALLAGECWETSQSVIVRSELPGMRKEDIDISIDRGRLKIRGDKRTSGEADTYTPMIPRRRPRSKTPP
jgi:HSP20 family molecular chaperone IbpA